jgi:hypothetical protein
MLLLWFVVCCDSGFCFLLPGRYPLSVRCQREKDTQKESFRPFDNLRLRKYNRLSVGVLCRFFNTSRKSYPFFGGIGNTGEKHHTRLTYIIFQRFVERCPTAVSMILTYRVEILRFLNEHLQDVYCHLFAKTSISQRKGLPFLCEPCKGVFFC